jgi:hypothetical protein
MSLKTRILRISATVLVVVLFAGYFAFSTFFFNPLGGGIDAPIAALAPRDVDFFFAKSDARDLFDGFPRLAIEKRLEKHPGWQSFVASPECADLERELKIDESLAKLREAAKEIPLGLEPQNIFGGKEIAVAGYFRGRDLSKADWAVYGNANWAGKLGASLLFHPGLLGLEKRGITVTVDEKYVGLKGASLPRELFVTRIKDAVIVATKADLVTKALDLESKRFEDSFFQSADYSDYIQRAYRGSEHDELEAYVNTRKLVENLDFHGSWPDVKSQDFMPAFLGRIFQISSVKDILGVIAVDEGLSFDLHGEFSSEIITPEQTKLYRTHGFEQSQLLNDAARIAPADTSLFIYAHVHLGDLLRMLLASVEPALKTNLEDAFRNTGRYQNLEQLVNELDAALKDRLAIIVRPNDYPADPEGPSHDNEPVPAIAVVLWTQNVDAIKNLRELIGLQGSRFGLQGHNPNEPGYFKNLEGGHDSREFWSPLIRGTGIVTTVTEGDLTLITNSLGMLRHLLKTQTQGGEKYPRLSEEPRFAAMVQSSQKRANVLLWSNPKSAATILRKRAQRVALDSIHIDWRTERQRVEADVIRETVPGGVQGKLAPDVQEKVDKLVEPKLKGIEQKVKDEQVPAMMAKQERWISWFESATGVLLELALDPKACSLSLRMPIPLEPEK